MEAGYPSKSVLRLNALQAGQFRAQQQINHSRMKADLLPPLNPISQIFLGLPTKQQTAPPTQATLTKLPPGAKTIGNYLLGKNIGQGTFGKVHLAMHLPTGEKVAVKIIDKCKMRPKDIARVQGEISVLKRVRHRHVVTLYEIIETQKSLLLITEFLPNGELFRLILREKRLTEDQACAYFQQIVEAVDYLHRNNIAHRDLKPENILIDFDGQLKLIDFGLSASYEGRERLTTFCGSPCYAAPEMVEGKSSYSPLQADLWSCGIILFAMLCGHLPFCDADTHTLFKKIIACNYKVPAYLSPQAQDLIQNLLVLVPEQRISLEEIREHRWFNRVPASAAYGLDMGEQLPADSSILERLKVMGSGGARLRDEVVKNVKGKDTATYFILMKKLAKAGQLIPTYLASDHFNPKLIIRPQSKLPDEQDTESYNGPDSEQEFIKAPDAPQVPQMVPEPGPLAGSSNLWVQDRYYSKEQMQEIDQGELMLLAGGILDLFIPRSSSSQKPKVSQLEQVFPMDNHPFRKLAFQRREQEFYAQNKAHGKQLVALPTADKTLKNVTKHVRSSSKPTSKKGPQTSIDYARLNSEIKRHSNREKTEASRSLTKPSTAFEEPMKELQAFQPLKRNSNIHTMLRESKQSDIVLPNLPMRVEQLKSEFKVRYLSKKYKIFKNFIH